LLNKNTINRSKKNISLHYDLGNNFFQQWLDETMQYSSAHYNNKHKNLKMLNIINSKISIIY